MPTQYTTLISVNKIVSIMSKPVDMILWNSNTLTCVIANTKIIAMASIMRHCTIVVLYNWQTDDRAHSSIIVVHITNRVSILMAAITVHCSGFIRHMRFKWYTLANRSWSALFRNRCSYKKWFIAVPAADQPTFLV